MAFRASEALREGPLLSIDQALCILAVDLHATLTLQAICHRSSVGLYWHISVATDISSFRAGSAFISYHVFICNVTLGNLSTLNLAEI